MTENLEPVSNADVFDPFLAELDRTAANFEKTLKDAGTSANKVQRDLAHHSRLGAKMAKLAYDSLAERMAIEGIVFARRGDR